MENKVRYSDRESKILIKRRRTQVKIGYLLSLCMLLAFSIPFISFSIYGWNSSSISTRAYILSLWILGIIFGSLGLYYVFIVDEKNSLKYGIMLTNNYLQISKKKFMLATIIQAEIIRFPGSGIFLAIAYIYKRRGKEKIKTYLLKEDKTDNILMLCNMIRKLISLPEQTDPHTINSWIGWKKSLRQLEEL